LVQVNSHKGYTLIELLISMVILLSLMFTANYSYSLYSQYWAGRLGKFDQTVFYFQGLLQVKETVESAIPYVVKGSKGEPTFYFLGREEGFTLVTASPIFAPTINDAAVVRIFREQTDEGYQLVYEEAPMSEKLLLGLDQVVEFKYRTVLIRTVEPITFNYYGWQERAHKFERSDYASITPSWLGTYDAAVTRIQPLRLSINIQGQLLEYDLPEGHDKLINFYMEDGF
jgi:prepilin-type N-terminal cleavage/methylation domain-containing protein